MSKALIRAKTVRRPASQEVIGYRLEAAIPNMAGRKMKVRGSGNDLSFFATRDEAPSFRRPYLIREGSDETVLTGKKVKRFMESLGWEGYDQFELIGTYQGDPLEILLTDA